jgi:acetyl-CoA carboxylase biotin carboxyl carrier protein
VATRDSNRGEGNLAPRAGTAKAASRKTVQENETANTTNGSSFLTSEIRELIELMGSSDLTEINIENGNQKILIKREPPRVVMPEYAPPTPRGRAARTNAALPAAPSPAEILPISDPGAPPEDAFHKITAPMVGTFYRSPDPKAKSFVQEGDMVEKGQVIGIIEAMKIMNEIQSEHSGRCLRIVVENGQPVEYGQTLIVLEPA